MKRRSTEPGPDNAVSNAVATRGVRGDRAGETVRTGNFYFDPKASVERVWIVWSAKPQRDLESAKRFVNDEHRGEIKDPAEAAAVIGVLNVDAARATTAAADDASKRWWSAAAVTCWFTGSSCGRVDWGVGGESKKRMDGCDRRRGDAVGSLTTALAAIQQPDEPTRQIIAEEFLKARPAAAKPAPAKRPTYRPVSTGTAAVRPPAAAGTMDLGVTLWRLRPSQTADDGARLLVQDAAEMTAERIETGAPLSVGDRVRLSIESPAAGFLYVIDREQYEDGTMSEPYLIFPTSRTRQGDNAVRPGRLIDIPDQQDRPNYFSVRPSRPGQTGELITILVTPTALDSVTISDKPMVLAKDLVAGWEKSWNAPVQQFALDGGAKRIWTREEKAAAADGTRLLKQDDPPPQTIFRLSAKKGSPVLVNVKLPYATTTK